MQFLRQKISALRCRVVGQGLQRKPRNEHRISGCEEEKEANSNRVRCGVGGERKQANFSEKLIPEVNRESKEEAPPAEKGKDDMLRNEMRCAKTVV